MLTQHSLEHLHTLRLEGMACAFKEQLAQPAISFEERFALLIDREILLRDNKRLERLLKAARIKGGAAWSGHRSPRWPVGSGLASTRTA
jgi:hypothetical protein